MKPSKKNVWYLGFVSFFTDVSSEMIFPILPIFLTSVLKANMAIVGLIEGIAESVSSLLKLFSGILSDKTKKNKLIVFIGYSLSTITKPLLALSTHWGHVLGVRIADRVGKGIRTTPRDAIIAASIKKNERGKYFGLHRALDSAGAIVGTIIAAVLLYFFTNNFKLVFWLSVIPGIIALSIILFVKEKKQEIEKKEFKFSLKELSPELKKFLIILTIFNLANFSYAFLIIRAKEFMSLALIPVVYLVFNVVYASLSIPFGRLSDKIGRINVIAMGFFVFAIMSLGFAFFANNVMIWVLFAVYGLFMAITDGVSRAYVSDLALENKGTALGVYHTLAGIAVFPANLIGGLLWHKINVAAPFIYSTILSVIALILIKTFFRTKRL